MRQKIDALVLVPFEPTTAPLVDPQVRRTVGAHFYLPLGAALEEVEGYLGRGVNLLDPDIRASFSAAGLDMPGHRSLSSIALATILERAGLSWRVLDPGAQDLSWYRGALGRMLHLQPAVVGICTTFVTSLPWLRALVATARRAFPRATLVLGGYYYATDTKGFLSLDADVFFVGEGEVRFPRLIRALERGEPLETIPGIYYRLPDERLRFTGPPEVVQLREHCRPDWRLAGRIDPAVDVDHQYLEVGVETQRGCVFKCAFCTYRTLSPDPSIVDPETAAAAILATSVVRRGVVYLTDATATFPPRRFSALLEKLVERGGSPHPIWAYARVSDVNEENAQLMRRAGVRVLCIGQESGDQRMLDRMRKGTRVSQVAPAIRAAGRAGLTVTLGFIHGFPGETAESVHHTRRMLANINDGDPENPAVLVYKITPFGLQDFASVALDGSVRPDGTHHHLEYVSGDFDLERICRESLRSMIETSRVPHAPVCHVFLHRGRTSLGVEMFTHPQRAQIFRWLKALDRMLMIFVERDVFGTRPQAGELSRLKREILSPMGRRSIFGAAVNAGRSEVRARAIRVLRREWAREQDRGTGVLTRALTVGAVLRDSSSLGDTSRALRSGTYCVADGVERSSPELEPLARDLIGDATKRARTAKLSIV